MYNNLDYMIILLKKSTTNTIKNRNNTKKQDNSRKTENPKKKHQKNKKWGINKLSLQSHLKILSQNQLNHQF